MRKLLTDKILLFIFSNKLSPHTHFPNLKQTTTKISFFRDNNTFGSNHDQAERHEI